MEKEINKKKRMDEFKKLEDKFLDESKEIFNIWNDVYVEWFLLKNKEKIVNFLNKNQKFIKKFNQDIKKLEEVSNIKDFIKVLFVKVNWWFESYWSKINDWITWLHILDQRISFNYTKLILAWWIFPLSWYEDIDLIEKDKNNQNSYILRNWICWRNDKILKLLDTALNYNDLDWKLLVNLKWDMIILRIKNKNLYV